MAKIVSSGGTLTTEKYLERKIRARRKKLAFIFVFLILIVSLATFVSRLSKLRIQDVAVSGANVIGADTVMQYSENILNGYYFWLIPKNNFLVYPRSVLRSDLMKEFPRFSSVNLALNNLNQLSISVVEREPYALYCADPTTTESNCFFLDKTGFIFDEAPTFSSGVYFVYSMTPAIEVAKGRRLMPQAEFATLVQFINNLSSLGLHATGLNVNQDNFDLSFGQSAHLLWKGSQDINTIYSNLKSFLNSPAIQAQKDFLSTVTLLDLRTDNKVFYK